jgi:hypothetical protein
VSALEQALSVTKTTDVNFAKLTAEIERQAAALTKATNAAKLYSNSTKQPQLALAPGKGPSQFVFQGPSAQDIADEQRNLRRQQKITQRVDYFSTGGASPADRGLLPRPDIEAIQQDRDLATARKRTAAETLKTITTENKQRAQQAAARRKQIGSRVSGAIGSGLIGGGFPLLFGQGAGAAAGGAIGAIGGGGPFGAVHHAANASSAPPIASQRHSSAPLWRRLKNCRIETPAAPITASTAQPSGWP